MFSKDHRNIRGVELLSESLVEGHAVSSDFHRINSGDSLLPVVNSVIKEFVGLGGEVDAVLGELVADLGELAPVGGLMLSGDVLVRDDTNVDLFNWILELVHQHIGIGLVDGLLLVLVHANEGESNSLDVEIVDHRMSEEIVGIEHH